MGPAKKKSNINAEKKVLRAVKQTIADHRMLARGDSVLIAVSGGPDSIVLAHVLHALSAEYGLRFGIAHLNHCLRDEESERDAEFVADFARKLGVPFYIEKANVRRFQQNSHFSLEEAARAVRYTFFETLAARFGFSKIATGHNGNDNAEQVLLNLLRGSGPQGLSGIRPIRNGKILRPLIRLQRSDIMNYIDEKRLSYVTDSSNSDRSFRRNRIRCDLIPHLEKFYNTGIIETLNRLTRIMLAEDQWIENLIKPGFEKCILDEKPGALTIDIERLAGLAIAAKRRLIRMAIFTVKKDLRRISLPHIDAVLRLSAKGPLSGLLDLPDGIQVVARGSSLTIQNTKGDRAAGSHTTSGNFDGDYQYSLAAPGALAVVEAGAILTLAEISLDDVPDFSDLGGELAFFDMDCLQFPLVVRNLRPGDRFSPLGVNGTQKIKKYFSDHKIDGLRRRICPLVVCRDKVIWIAGHRIDNSVKIVSTTRRVLKGELLLA